MVLSRHKSSFMATFNECYTFPVTINVLGNLICHQVAPISAIGDNGGILLVLGDVMHALNTSVAS